LFLTAPSIKKPPPREVRIHPRQGGSDSQYPWGNRQNAIYEVIRE